jgi:hypothetical protein
MSCLVRTADVTDVVVLVVLGKRRLEPVAFSTNVAAEYFLVVR